MKTNLTLKIFKPSTLAILTIAIVAASVTQSVMAQVPNHQLVFTEDSSGLTVTYDGSSITATPTGPQRWSIQFPSKLSFDTTTGFGWFEPGSIIFQNAVTFGSTSNPTQVSSDTAVTAGFFLFGDEGSAPVGTDTSNNAGIAATFDDDGEPATVPETGSTFGLLLLAPVALVSATRRNRMNTLKSSLRAGLFLVTLSVSASTARADFTSVSIESQTNADIRTYTQGGNYPVAPTNISVAGVPFQLVPLVTEPGNPNTLGVIQAPGGNSSFLITTDVPGATTVYTLMNSAFGEAGANIGSIEFKGLLGSDVVFQIVEGDNIRDHFNGFFNNSATNIVPDAFLNGSQNPSGADRLDMQTFVLPSSFASDTLSEIIFSGANAGIPQGEPFLAAATAATAAVPEATSSWALLALGLAAIFSLKRFLPNRACAIGQTLDSAALTK